MGRPIILLPTGFYLPGFKAGGPVRSIANLVDSLGDEFDFRIICADRDLGDVEPYRGIETNRWTTTGKALIHYTSSGGGRRALYSVVKSTPHDLLYLNSFFSPQATIIPLLARRLGMISKRPTIMAPRGEFSAGAIAIRSAKKKAYVSAGKMMGLFRGLTWQATSPLEADDIRRTMGGLAREIRVAANLSESIGENACLGISRRDGAPFRIIFLSRIAPKKNLDYALRVLSRVSTPVVFSIYGPAEDPTYHEECLRLASQLAAHVQVRWEGPVEPSQVPKVMAANDLFFLPTRGENYGHVIAEALGAGTPVLLSDATPWRGLGEAGVGWDLPLENPSAFVSAIEAAAAQDSDTQAAQRACVFRYAKRRQDKSADVEANRELFRRAIAAGR